MIDISTDERGLVSYVNKVSTCKVIADSVNPDGKRLRTLQLSYPRFIHEEFMTHRVFSRNAASSRAIPVARMVQQVKLSPGVPVSWGTNQAGMQAGEENSTPVPIPAHLYSAFQEWLKVEGADHFGFCAADLDNPLSLFAQVSAETAWKFSAWLMASMSESFSAAHYHKQVANRLTQPFQLMKVVVSSTDFDNWDMLRDHPKADPTIQDLAVTMKAAMAASTPKDVGWGQYHLPYLEDSDLGYTMYGMLMICTARGARVSYGRHDGLENTATKDFELHETLVGSEPRHATPAEHPACALRGQYANFNGWCSYRWQLEHHVRVLHGWDAMGKSSVAYDGS